MRADRFLSKPVLLALVSLSGRGSRVSGKFYSKMEYSGLKLELMSGYLLFHLVFNKMKGGSNQ